MTGVKKAYASLMAVQEGNIIPKDEQLDIKGIASMAKSSMSESTRKALKNILLEDILKAPAIDQFKIIEKLAILERKIINSVQAGDASLASQIASCCCNVREAITTQGFENRLAIQE